MIKSHELFLLVIRLICDCARSGDMSDWHFQSRLISTPPLNTYLLMATLEPTLRCPRSSWMKDEEDEMKENVPDDVVSDDDGTNVVVVSVVVDIVVVVVVSLVVVFAVVVVHHVDSDERLDGLWIVAVH